MRLAAPRGSGEGDHAREALGYLVFEPVPRVVVFVGVADDEILVGLVVMLHAVVGLTIPALFYVVRGTVVLVGGVPSIAQAREAEVGVAPLLHRLKLEAAEEEWELAFLARDCVSHQYADEVHVPPRGWVGSFVCCDVSTYNDRCQACGLSPPPLRFAG